MKRGLALLLSPILIVTLIIACSDDNSSPTTTTGSSSQQTRTDSSLTAPTIQSPEVGEAIETVQPELIVGNASGGSGPRTYIFELAVDSAFQNIAITESGVEEGMGGMTMWRVTEPLDGGMKYFWRARAATSAGDGPNSESSEFRTKDAFTRNRNSGGLVVFDPLIGGTVGEQMGGRFVSNGWQAESPADCIRYAVPVMANGRIEFDTTNVNSPNPVKGSRMLVSSWDPSKGDYTTNPFRMHLQKLDRNTTRRWDVRLRWISRTQQTDTGISFFDFEPEITYRWRIEWGDADRRDSQEVKVFLDELEILNRFYDRPYTPNPFWIELGNCERQETLEEAIWSNIRIGAK